MTTATHTSAANVAGTGSGRPLRILLDMDGVLADFDAAITARAKLLGAPTPTGPAAASFELADRYGPLGHQVKAAIREQGFYADLEPIAGAVEGVRRLLDAGLDVWICTAPTRTRWCAGEKFEWADRIFGREVSARTVVTKDKTVVVGDLLIDDKPDICGADTPQWRQMLFDQPYNRHVDLPRLLSWDVPDLVDQVVAAASAPVRCHAR